MAACQYVASSLLVRRAEAQLDAETRGALAVLDEFMRALRAGAWERALDRTEGEDAFLQVIGTLGVWRGIVDDWNNHVVGSVGRDVPNEPNGTLAITAVVQRCAPFLGQR